MLLLSWFMWIVASILLSLAMPWRSYLPAVLSDMLTYGKLKRDTGVHEPLPPSSSPSFLRLILRAQFKSDKLLRNFCRFFSISHHMHTLNSVPRRCSYLNVYVQTRNCDTDFSADILLIFICGVLSGISSYSHQSLRTHYLVWGS